ncbi:MAG: Twin-arginine translocation protein TatA, partial [Myxococcaceae bacterium]|nr:Twin-arginine translocation protein TatA [Myxococcaceae bacterium]
APARAAPVPVGAPRRSAPVPLGKGAKPAPKAAAAAPKSDNATDDDAAALEVIQRFLRERGGLHLAPGIPAHAERTARGTHEDELPDDEAILALFLSDEGGFVVTSGSFYWHDGDGATASIDWEDFDVDDLTIEDDELYIEDDLVPTGGGQHGLSRQLQKTIAALSEWAQ